MNKVKLPVCLLQCTDTVGWAAGRYPVACKNLRPLILSAVMLLVRGRATCMYKTCFKTSYYQGQLANTGSPRKWPLEAMVYALCVKLFAKA